MIRNEVVGASGTVTYREEIDLAAGTVAVQVGGSGTRSLPAAERRRYVGLPSPTQFVALSGDNTLDGSSWDTAKADLNAAVDALPRDGGVIFLGVGVWNGRWRIDKPNVHVIGSGWGTGGSVLRLPDETDITANTLTITGDGSSIWNVRIDGNRDNNAGNGDGLSDGIAVYADHTLVEHCWITGARSHAYIVWGNSATLANGQNAARAAGARRYNRFIGNVVEKNGCAQDIRAAVDWAYLGGDSSLVPTDWEASGNTIIGNQYGRTCFTSHSGRRGRITNNTMYGVTMLVELHTGSLDIVVANNVMVAANSMSSGVLIRTNTKRITVTGNTFTTDGNGNNRTQGMVYMQGDGCDLIKITDNTSFDAGTFGDACLLRYEGVGRVELIGNTLTSKPGGNAYLVRGVAGTSTAANVAARFNRCVDVVGAFTGTGTIDARDNWGIADI